MLLVFDTSKEAWVSQIICIYSYQNSEFISIYMQYIIHNFFALSIDENLKHNELNNIYSRKVYSNLI